MPPRACLSPWRQLRYRHSDLPSATPSLTDAELKRVLETAVSDQDGAKKGNNVLVVDEESLRMINASMPSAELMKSGFISG